MAKWTWFSFFSLFAIGCLSAQNAFVIDHTDVAKFDSIPEEWLEAARNTRMVFSDRSVGQNVHEALDYLTYPSWAQSPSSARRDYTDADWHWKTFTQADWDAGLVPTRIRFNPDPVRYDRSRWHFVLKSGSWSQLTQDFIQTLGPEWADSTDVWSYQFSYLNVTPGDNIADPQTGFFSDNPNAWDIHDLETFLGQHPDITFVYWTTSLARGIGSAEATAFNDQLRAWCQAHDRILFDFADITSHTDLGIPCVDNRDGVPYISQTGQTEDYPDDGIAYPAICQDYTTETDGGHLGSVSAGGITVVKALWVLMARIAGWDGVTTSVSGPGQENVAGWTLAPQPALDRVSVSCPGACTGQFTLTDLAGRMLRQWIGNGLPDQEVDLSGLPPGMYALSRLDDRGRTARPLVITGR